MADNTSGSDAAQKLHQAWVEFCDDLKRNGEIMLREGTPRNEIDQAEGYRFLCRLVRSGLENGFEHARAPSIGFRPKDPYLHVGFTSPDQDPFTCTIDPSREYRIYGTRGTNAGIGLLAMDPATMQHVGWLNHHDIKVAPDGTFEIIASQREHPGKTWLKLTPGTSMVVIRRNFNDRASEIPAEFKIEELDPPAPHRRAIGVQDVVAGLKVAKMSTAVMSGRMVEWAEELVQKPNQINVLESYMRSSGSPDHNFRFGYFELRPNQAIELKFKPPVCDNWQFQIGNWWVENLDNYEDNQGWINKHRARVGPDGDVTIYASPEKVDAPNWVDTLGRYSGVMGLRIICGESSPALSVQVVAIPEIAPG